MVWIPPVVNEVVIEAIPSAFVTAEKLQHCYLDW